MNRKEYVLIAQAIKEERKQYLDTSINDQAREIMTTFTYSLARRFKAEYKNFDEDKFMAEAGL